MPKTRARPRAARLTPQERRTQILDSAVELIVRDGLLCCSLEEVAASAGISKPLVYRYFASREELLDALIAREYDVLKGAGVTVVPRAQAFQDVVTSSTAHWFQYLYERGAVLQALAQYRPGVDQTERAQLTKYLAQQLVATYGVSRQAALIETILVMNAPAAAVRALKNDDVSAEDAAAVWSTFALGGFAAVSARFGPGKAPAARRARGARSRVARKPASKRS